MGLAQIRGRKAEARSHLMKVRNFDISQADAHIKEAFLIWRQRNRIDWKLDLSILENTGIKLADKVKQNERRNLSRKKLKEVGKKE